MSRVSTLNQPAAIKCPQCGREAEADPIQLQGRCSLICPFCNYHFYITPKVDGIAQVVEGARAELAE